jgi:hypothetical protein
MIRYINMALLYSIISERYVDDTIFTDNRYYFYHKFSYRFIYIGFVCTDLFDKIKQNLI